MRFFRALSVAGILLGATLYSLLVLFPEAADPQDPTINALDLLGALTAFCLLLPWPAAFFHWRRRFPPHPHWIRWGIIVFFGGPPGAWAYWIVASRHYEAVDALAQSQPTLDA